MKVIKNLKKLRKDMDPHYWKKLVKINRPCPKKKRSD